MTSHNHYSRIIGIYPTRRGFGFAVLEQRGRLVDWGVARLYSNKDEEFLQRLEAMIDKYGPVTMVFEEVTGKRRSERALRRIAHAVEYSERRGLQVRYISRAEARHALGYSEQVTRHELAYGMARWHPELEALLPPKKKPWQSENERMNMFDSVAMVTAANA